MDCGTIFMIIFGIVVFGLMIYFIDKASYNNKPKKEKKDRIFQLEQRIWVLENPPKFKKGNKVGEKEYDYQMEKYTNKIIRKGKVVKCETDFNGSCFGDPVYRYKVIFGNDLVDIHEGEIKKL